MALKTNGTSMILKNEVQFERANNSVHSVANYMKSKV